MSTYKTDLERAIEAAERGSLSIGGMNAEGYATRLPVAAKTSEGRAVRVILEDAKAVIAERDRLRAAVSGAFGHLDKTGVHGFANAKYILRKALEDES